MKFILKLLFTALISSNLITTLTIKEKFTEKSQLDMTFTSASTDPSVSEKAMVMESVISPRATEIASRFVKIII